MNFIRRAFPRYHEYGNAEMKDLLSYLDLTNTLQRNGYQLFSCYVENIGNHTFYMQPLPIEAQFAPIFGMLADDFNNDHYLDILFVGNTQSTEIINGWCDASYGGVLLGNGKGDFEFAENRKTSWWIEEDAKALARVQGNPSIFLTSINSGPLQTYQYQRHTEGHTIFLEPNDVWAEITWENGSRQKSEFYYGEGYLSQSSRVLHLDSAVSSIKIFDYQGNTRALAPTEKLLLK
jgi:hypothetical protein